MTATAKIPPLLRKYYPPVLYLAGFLLARLAGFRMHIPFDFFQLQSREWLQYDLWRSIFYLHSQPPLTNLWLGLGLKFAWLFGLRAESVLLLFHFAIGLPAAWCIGSFTREFIRDTRLAFACNLLLLLHPVIYASMHQYFYTFHEWALLAALAWAVRHHLSSPQASRLALVAILLLLLAYTRSLFHFLWAFMVFLPLAACGIRSPNTHLLRRRAFLCAVFALLLLAWPLKNLFLFGFFGFSSWQGANFSQGIVMNDFPIAIDAEIPPHLRDVPCVSEKLKFIEQQQTQKLVAYNYNHYSLIETSNKLQDLSMDMIRKDPGIFWRKVCHNYWAFTRFTGRQPHYADFGMGGESLGFTANAWMKIYELMLNQDIRSKEQLKAPAYRADPQSRNRDAWFPSLLWLVLPSVLILAFFRIARKWRTLAANELTAFFMLLTIAWVLGMVLLIDGREGNRMRFSTETYFIWLVFWLIDGFRARRQITTMEGLTL